MSDFPQPVILPVRRSLGEGESITKDPSLFVGGVPPPRDSSISRGFFATLRMTKNWRAHLHALRSLGEAGPARAVSGLVRVYQLTVSPALVALNPSCGCRFATTCSHYAREALREHGLLLGLIFTLRRLVKCGPWHPGGIDPVPLAEHKTTGRQDHRAARTKLPCCYSVRRPSSVVPPSLSHG
jgi:putative membrane protein insertion efficiency factor